MFTKQYSKKPCDHQQKPEEKHPAEPGVTLRKELDEKHLEDYLNQYMHQYLVEVGKNLTGCDVNRKYAFISYNSTDRPRVWPVVRHLQQQGYNIWIDEKSLDKSKKDWHDSCIHAIKNENCALLLFFASRYSLKSLYCSQEIQAATERENAGQTPGGKQVAMLVVEVTPLGDIGSYLEEQFKELNSSEQLADDVRKTRLTSLTRFQKCYNNNNRVRVRSENDDLRFKDYYEELESYLRQYSVWHTEKANAKQEIEKANQEERKLLRQATEAIFRSALNDRDLKQYAEASRKLKFAAEFGHAQAALRLAEILRKGNGIEKDEAAALSMYELAEKNGSARAAYELGRIYETGQCGVSAISINRMNRAQEQYEKSGNNGYRRAKSRLKLILSVARSIPEDHRYRMLAKTPVTMVLAQFFAAIPALFIPPALQDAKPIVPGTIYWALVFFLCRSYSWLSVLSERNKHYYCSTYLQTKEQKNELFPTLAAHHIATPLAALAAFAWVYFSLRGVSLDPSVSHLRTALTVCAPFLLYLLIDGVSLAVAAGRNNGLTYDSDYLLFRALADARDILTPLLFLVLVAYTDLSLNAISYLTAPVTLLLAPGLYLPLKKGSFDFTFVFSLLARLLYGMFFRWFLLMQSLRHLGIGCTPMDAVEYLIPSMILLWIVAAVPLYLNLFKDK